MGSGWYKYIYIYYNHTRHLHQDLYEIASTIVQDFKPQGREYAYMLGALGKIASLISYVHASDQGLCYLAASFWVVSQNPQNKS